MLKREHVDWKCIIISNSKIGWRPRGLIRPKRAARQHETQVTQLISEFSYCAWLVLNPLFCYVHAFTKQAIELIKRLLPSVSHQTKPMMIDDWLTETESTHTWDPAFFFKLSSPPFSDLSFSFFLYCKSLKECRLLNLIH
jgi:hypothetical protein